MQLIRDLFLSQRLFILIGIGIFLLIFAFLYPQLLFTAQLFVFTILFLLSCDILLIFRWKDGIKAERIVPDKFSNGDPNPIQLGITNLYPFDIKGNLIDELPFQFQLRDQVFDFKLQKGQSKQLQYQLRPVERGEYHFGKLNIQAETPLGLVRRRFRLSTTTMVPTYPSFIQMRQYQLMAISNRLTEFGVKKIRRLGHTTEFEQIKEYVRGDDYRTINWKATARSGKLMVNQYTDEKAQNVFCLIDKSRIMKMPFEGMSLLDYAINATLVISNIAILKKDKAGMITFAEKIDQSVPASNRGIHMKMIMEVLYNQQTRFLEADYERLYVFIKRKIAHRSLLILYTNFESLSGMRRQLPYLKLLAKAHLLLVIFFENTELNSLIQSSPKNTEEVYVKTMGEYFAYEKEMMVRELEKNGILCILTKPQQLTVDTVNKYLELKSRGMI